MGSPSHRSRPGAWSLAVLLPGVAAVAATAIGYALGAAWAWDAAFTAAAVCAVAGMALGRRRAVPGERDRWTWWVLAAACWLIGQVGWDVFAVVGSPPSPNLADYGWWAFAVLVVLGLVRLPAGPSTTVRLVAVVEALPLIVAAVALTFSQLWPAADASSLPWLQRLSALLYPAVYASAAIVTLQAMIGGALRHVRGAGPRLVLAGIVAQAFAFILWSKQLLEDRYVLGHTVDDPLWVAGLLAIGAGGLVAARVGRDEAAAEAPATEHETTPWGGVLPGAVFILLIAALVKAQLDGLPVGARLTLATGLLFCGATLIARGTLLEIRLRGLLAHARGANERLLEDSRRDPLTGLRNRRALAEDLAAVQALAARRGGAFAVLLCDVDRFKAYNDHVGHLGGDRALRTIAAVARAELRGDDAAYRYGGEELLVLLPDADAAAALVVAERIRTAVSRAGIAHPAGVAPVLTVSIGVAAGAGDAAGLLARADAALYDAKHAGRNRVMAASGEAAATGHRPPAGAEDPAARQLRGLLEVARAGAWATEQAPVLEALAAFIHGELRYQTVVVNLRDEAGGRLDVVHVLGDEDVRAALLGTASAMVEWERLLDRSRHPSGAVWLPKGAYEWDVDVAVWTPAGPCGLEPDAWDPEDMLLLPLRDAAGSLLAVVSVDEPLHGARPDDADLATLMTAAEHAALALEQVARRSGDLAAR